MLNRKTIEYLLVISNGAVEYNFIVIYGKWIYFIG